MTQGKDGGCGCGNSGKNAQDTAGGQKYSPVKENTKLDPESHTDSSPQQ
jgi:hypothetical protein